MLLFVDLFVCPNDLKPSKACYMHMYWYTQIMRIYMLLLFASSVEGTHIEWHVQIKLLTNTVYVVFIYRPAESLFVNGLSFLVICYT